MGRRDTGYIHIHQSEALTVLWLFIFYLSLLDSKCTVCKYFSDSIQSLFLITKFEVDSSHFHINLIAYCVVMRDSPGVLSDIINVLLAFLHSGYNLPVYYLHEVESHVFSKDILDWCGHYITVIRGPNFPYYIC